MKTFKPNSANTIVKKILEINPATRDDDYALYSNYLSEMSINPFNCSANQLLLFIHDKKLQCPATIFRRRRGIQNLFPDLRGNKWNKRHNEIKQSFEDELGYSG